MGWHYVAVRHENDGEVEYALHEAYPSIKNWTERPVRFYADSPAELAKMLRAAADDVERTPPIEGEWPGQQAE